MRSHKIQGSGDENESATRLLVCACVPLLKFSWLPYGKDNDIFLTSIHGHPKGCYRWRKAVILTTLVAKKLRAMIASIEIVTNLFAQGKICLTLMKKGSIFRNIGQNNRYSSHCLISLAFSHLHYRFALTREHLALDELHNSNFVDHWWIKLCRAKMENLVGPLK